MLIFRFVNDNLLKLKIDFFNTIYLDHGFPSPTPTRSSPPPTHSFSLSVRYKQASKKNNKIELSKNEQARIVEDTFNADIILNLEKSYRNSVRNSCALPLVPKWLLCCSPYIYVIVACIIV